MKFANVNNEFEMTDIMQKKYFHCWSASGATGQYIAIYLPYQDLQEVLGETDSTLLVKLQDAKLKHYFGTFSKFSGRKGKW